MKGRLEVCGICRGDSESSNEAAEHMTVEIDHDVCSSECRTPSPITIALSSHQRAQVRD